MGRADVVATDGDTQAYYRVEASGWAIANLKVPVYLQTCILSIPSHWENPASIMPHHPNIKAVLFDMVRSQAAASPESNECSQLYRTVSCWTGEFRIASFSYSNLLES